MSSNNQWLHHVDIGPFVLQFEFTELPADIPTGSNNSPHSIDLDIEEALVYSKIGRDYMRCCDADNRCMKFRTMAEEVAPYLDPRMMILCNIGVSGPIKLPLYRSAEELSSVASSSSTNAAAEAARSSEMPRKYTEEQRIVMVNEVMSKRDHYDVLGLNMGCTEQDIRKAFRGWLLKVHPEVNKAPRSEDAYNKVTKAFEVLINDEKRDYYDLFRSNGHFSFWDSKRVGFEMVPDWFENNQDKVIVDDEVDIVNEDELNEEEKIIVKKSKDNSRFHDCHFYFIMATMLIILPVMSYLTMSKNQSLIYSVSKGDQYQFEMTTPKGIKFYLDEASARWRIHPQKFMTIDRNYHSGLVMACNYEKRLHWLQGFINGVMKFERNFFCEEEERLRTAIIQDDIKLQCAGISLGYRRNYSAIIE